MSGDQSFMALTEEDRTKKFSDTGKVWLLRSISRPENSLNSRYGTLASSSLLWKRVVRVRSQFIYIRSELFSINSNIEPAPQELTGLSNVKLKDFDGKTICL